MLIPEKNTYVQSWYPLACSKDLKAGKVILCKAFEREIVVFRSEDGEQLGAFWNHCVHMGADLSKAEIVNDCLRCPLHHWEFNREGICTSNQSGLKQKALHVQEYYGIIFIFLGEEPLYEFPFINSKLSPRISKVYVQDFNAPNFLVSMNAYDLQHFSKVHGRQFTDYSIKKESPYNLSIDFKSQVIGENLTDRIMRKIGINEVHNIVDSWSDNILVGTHVAANTSMFAATLPISDNKTRLFFVFLQAREPESFMTSVFKQIKFRIMQPFSVNFIQQDAKTLDNFKPTLEHLDPALDEGLYQWLEYYSALPTITLSER